MSEYLLEMKGMCRDFSGIRVLDNVSLSLKEGEVMAIVGENGAGKSTLIRTLSGSLSPTEGEIYIDGKKMDFKGPVDGLVNGISVIYQELNYYDQLSIAENIFAGRLPKKAFGGIDWKKINDESDEIIKKVGLYMPASTLVKDLTVSQKQLVEIAKAISRNARIIVMDEPTAALNDTELESLFEVIDGLKESGICVIYISHKLNEILRVADYAKVLRDGKDVGTLNRDEFDKSKIVQMMVGREIKDMYPKVEIEAGEKLLELENINGGILKDVSLNVREGEIVSVFGLMGNGAHALLDYVFGAKRIDRGTIKLKGETLNIKAPADAIAKGMAYVPPERKSEGLVLMHSVRQNLSMPSLDEYAKRMKMDVSSEEEDADETIKRLSIKVNTMNDTVGSLSGGNQQKVVIGKWIKKNPSLLIVCEPTRGIDVGAKIEVYKLLEEMCKKGIGVLMVSSELPETLAMSDRVYVINEGRILGEFSKEEANQENLMSCIVGGKSIG